MKYGGDMLILVCGGEFKMKPNNRLFTAKKQFLLFLLCLAGITTLLVPLRASAETPPKVVRVGWYESAFHRTDQFGRRSGYGYEYQQRIATYTGWTYEYVEGSWSELFEMLVAGEIDLLSDVSYTEARAEKILYSAEPMGGEDYHVFIAPDNTEIRPDDFTSFNGKRVGVNKNSIQEQLFIEWAEKHNVQPVIVELSVKTPELLEMLENGEIDMLVTLDTYGNSADIVPVCKVGSAESYFGINKNRPDLKEELDLAMIRLLEDNRDFNQQLTEKFNRASGVNSFLNAEEKDWLEEHGTIRVGYRRGFLPFCDQDEKTGELRGALADYLSFAETCEKNARLSFETIGFDTADEALKALADGEVDCLFPVTLSAYDGEQLGVILTDPFVSTVMYVIVRTADDPVISPDIEKTVATAKGHLNHETFVKDNYPNWKIAYFDSSEEGLQAVSQGEADCGLVSSYRISRFSKLFSKYHLSPLATGQSMDLAFAIRRDDDCLYSILNKVNRLMPETDLNASLTKYALNDERVTFMSFMRDNLAAVIAAIAVVTAVILFLVLRNVKSEAKAMEEHRLITETERDSLTQLYNKNFFNAYAERLYRDHPEKPMDAIAMNIERFRTLNLLNGREYGDEVLKTVASEITEFISETVGIAARTEGDSFELYCAHQEDYESLFNRFQSRLDDDSRVGKVRFRMGVMPWQSGLTPEQMFVQAWSACGAVRGDYKRHLLVYDEELRRKDELNQRLHNDLATALENGELEVFYQPKFDIRPDQPVLNSAEALIRWNHPVLGRLMPGDFIPMFERSGQISAVDRFVCEEAARQVALWRDRYGITLPVSVNLSRIDVFEPTLSDKLDEILTRNGLDRNALHLEITESAYTEDSDQVIRVIGRLREKGYLIEMDDFGSGYSSLNMLSQMPVDVLKMDMAFIRNMEHSEQDLNLVKLILDIARNLKVPVVAEGVETEKQLQVLKELGCALVQGYYFSCPLPAAEFEETVIKKS